MKRFVKTFFSLQSQRSPIENCGPAAAALDTCSGHTPQGSELIIYLLEELLEEQIPSVHLMSVRGKEWGGMNKFNNRPQMSPSPAARQATHQTKSNWKRTIKQTNKYTSICLFSFPSPFCYTIAKSQRVQTEIMTLD